MEDNRKRLVIYTQKQYIIAIIWHRIIREATVLTFYPGGFRSPHGTNPTPHFCPAMSRHSQITAPTMYLYYVSIKNISFTNFRPVPPDGTFFATGGGESVTS